MKKILFIVLAGLSTAAAFAASDKDTAAVVKDEKADNAQDKQAVKKASPKALQSAKEEADKTKAQPSKGQTGSQGSSK
jgi:Ni/Co efflux regulator RcnB